MTGAAGHCSLCGATSGPFAKVEPLFTALICMPCLEVRQVPAGHPPQPARPGPYPAMTHDQLRESLALLPSWVLAQMAAANRQLIAVMRQRLTAGD